MLRLDLERERGRVVLHCTACGRTVHWVAGLAATPVTAARRTCAAREAEVPLEHHAAECRDPEACNVISRVFNTQLQPTLTDVAKGGGVEAQEEHAQKSR